MSGKLLGDLNSEQRAAVTFGEGPLLVLAGVGTGKTTVITRRIAWLIAEKKATPAEILALTFTERAAAEMEERVDLLVPYGYIEAQIGTFHSFCDRLLRENAVRLGLSSDYRILTEPEQLIFLKDHLFELPLERFRPLGNPVKHLRAILTLFSRAKDEEVTPEEYLTYTETLARQAREHADEEAKRQLKKAFEDHQELANVYKTYQRLLAEHGYVDFGDLIALALRLLREHPNVLERYKDRFRYILVDEFQDTNYAQFELLKHIAEEGNLTVCGDDDQSIYKFRGAAISNILNFKGTYPNADLIVLKENYRSTQPILDAAYRLIQHNNPDRLEEREGIPKRLRAVKGSGLPIHQRHFERLGEECDFVAETIAARVKEEKRSYRDFAVLVRSNAQAAPFLHALNLLHIPWHFSGSRGLYDREEVKTVLAFLRLLADPRDNLSFHYLACSDFYRVSAEDLTLATSFARRRNKSLFEVFRIASKRPDFLGFSEEGRTAITRLVDDLTVMLPHAAQAPTGDVLYEYLTTRTGRIESLSNSGRALDTIRLQNLAKLFSIIERFSHVCRYDRVPWFIDYLDALIEAGDNPPVGEAEWDEDAVNVLTVHQAKGLEFHIVFLVGLVAGRFPAIDRRDPIPLPDPLVKDIVTTTDFHQQEERRLFYVGMTRAKEELFLMSAQDYGGKRPRKPSLFVSEALDLPPAAIKVLKGSPIKTISRHGKPPTRTSSEEKTEEPFLIPSSATSMLSLSHQKIDDYLTCPKKYRYIHILKVPIRQHHTVIYGHAIHQAIRHYHMTRLAGEVPPLSDLEKVFRAAWRAEGFLTRQHEELRLREGLTALERFYAYEQQDETLPTYVERHFSFVENGIRIVGIFDRIDMAGDEAVIIDYKTSTVSDTDQAAKRTKESRQLAIYALAYERLFGKLPVRLELRFLTPAVVVGGYRPTEKALERALSDIETAAAGVRGGDFVADPDYLACTYCPYRAICLEKEST
jgi:DNA helicase-2/ATP-dependent DNA helicase PcrA